MRVAASLAICCIGISGCGRPHAPSVRKFTLTTGGTVELAAVSHPGSKTSWNGGGKRLPSYINTNVTQMLEAFSGLPGATGSFWEKNRIITLRLHPATLGEPSVVWNASGGSGSSGVEPIRTGDPRSDYLASNLCNFKLGTQSANFDVGVADGKWKVVAKANISKGSITRTSGLSMIVSVSEKPNTRGQDHVCDVEIPTRMADRSEALSVVAYDQTEKPMRSAGSWGGPSMSHYFFMGSVNDVSRVEVRTRPYQWITFKDVRMNPN
jgi:hypothetical protein